MSKLRYMLEQPEYPVVLVVDSDGSENPSGGANQQATEIKSISGASEATREALRSNTEVMIWSAPHSDMGRQAEQETTCPRKMSELNDHSVSDKFRSNNMDLRPRTFHNFSDSEHHRRDPDI
jgi:hypothetical protein